MHINDIARKRAILFSARVQFSPELQPIKETAIDKLIEQSLFVGFQGDGLTLQQIEGQRTFSLLDSIPSISQREAVQSLRRLENKERVIAQNSSTGVRYRLSDRAMVEIQDVQKSVELRLDRIIGRLFRNAERKPADYTDAFLECLSFIFAHLGDYYVQVLQDRKSKTDWLKAPRIGQAIQATGTKYQCAKDISFGRAVRQFFTEDDPDFNKVKWNLSQNYYIAKTLGLDKDGALLSKEVFGNAQFYLDTNILFQAVEPRMRHNRSFQALISACKRLGATVQVCQISIDEMRNAVGVHRDLILKVDDNVPEELASRVKGGLYELYHDEKQHSGSVNIDALFLNFIEPMKILTPQYSVELLDDEWFTSAKAQSDIAELSKNIIALSQQRPRPKTRGSAQHDAKMLWWVQKDREAGNRNTWFVTLDTLLPNVNNGDDKDENRPLAISLDALLQWISPIAMQGADGDEVAAIFAEAIKSQLLPSDAFFDLRDFLVFSELEISCKDLPVDDVEECLQYLRKTASNLNPADPKDLQTLGLEIHKFFADPGRRYKQDVARLEEESAQKDAKLEEVTSALTLRLDNLQHDFNEKFAEQQRKEEERRITEQRLFEEKLSALQREYEEKEEKRIAHDLLRSARRRLTIGSIVLMLLTVGVIYLTVIFGDQAKSAIERITSGWVILIATFVIGLAFLGLFLGRARIQVLELPGAEWWKGASGSAETKKLPSK